VGNGIKNALLSLMGIQTMKGDYIAPKAGFTLVEAMMAAGLFGLIMVGTMEVYLLCNKLYRSASLNMQATQESMRAVSRMVYGMETNNGLRAASLVLYQTNAYGYPYPFSSTNKYWETGASPPDASNPAYYTLVESPYGTDGSWRLIISNSFDNISYIDYNSKMRTILFCPDINQTSAARQKRILICNYVSAAEAQTNVSDMNGVVAIKVKVEKQEGMFKGSNTVITIVKMRNEL
jgi:Tfp pilus assembly protein PilV